MVSGEQSPDDKDKSKKQKNAGIIEEHDGFKEIQLESTSQTKNGNGIATEPIESNLVPKVTKMPYVQHQAVVSSDFNNFGVKQRKVGVKKPVINVNPLVNESHQSEPQESEEMGASQNLPPTQRGLLLGNS